MSVLAQLAVIFLVCLISEVICALLPIAFHAAVMAMVLLLLLLFGRAFKPEQLRESSDFLLDHMAFFFVPAGVSIINYLDLLKSSLLPILVICVASTFITFAVTAWSIRLTMRLMNRRKGS